LDSKIARAARDSPRWRGRNHSTSGMTANSPTAVPPKGPQARSAVTMPLQQLPS
jgi:hypothetical protein